MSDGIICRCGDDGHDWDERSLRGDLGIRTRCRSYADPADDEWYLCVECKAAGHEPLDGRQDEMPFNGDYWTIDRGPYMSEDDGHDMFYPRGLWGWNEARRDAAGMARLSYSVAIYRGKRDFWITNDDGGPRIVDVPGYYFEAVER